MADTTWYFMDVRGRRQGPVADADVTSAYRCGEGACLSEGSKQAIAEFYSNRGYFPPNNASAGVAASTSIEGQYVDSVTIESTGVGSTFATITVHYGNRANQAIAGQSLVFRATSASGSTHFTCDTEAGTTLDVKYRPTVCRP